MRYRNILPLFFILTLFVAASCNQQSGNITSGTDQKTAINFTLDSLKENKQFSLDEFKGKGVVLNFWATWCGPCREEMPLFEETWSEFREDNVVFLGINVMDDQESAQKFMDSIGITYPNLYDPEGDVSRKYNVVALPATFFIDKDGNIVARNYGSFIGAQGKDALNENVKGISE